MKGNGYYATITLLASVLVITSADVGRSEQLGPFGPGLDLNTEVLRSFTMKTSGAVTKEVNVVKNDGKTGLTGLCNPNMFANFGIHRGGPFDQEQVGIALVSRAPIGTGATGTFPLNMVHVDFFDLPNGSRRFAGPGTLTLTVHESSSSKRRMTGSISGAKLKGLEKLEGKSLDVAASFDVDFSCGVK